jgi:uncharacterized protein (DUF927 family)/phage/plasmid primase-like uncharacterized protein
MSEALGQFREAMTGGGLIPSREIIADGRLHRCKVSGGKPGNCDGAYILFPGDFPAGGFQNWRDGRGWQNWQPNRPLSPREREELRNRQAQMKAAREQDEARRHDEARAKALRCWDAAKPANPGHDYLTRKAIAAYGIRQSRDRLIVPLRDMAGVLHSLQFIGTDGTKRFLTGGRKQGCFHLIGAVGETLLIAEGFATAASLHAATGLPVAVAFDCGNLTPVATALRAAYPAARLILCADDDHTTEGNPGMTHARAAAAKVGAAVIAPDFGDARPDGANDFNDMAQLRGPEAVNAVVTAATPPRRGVRFSYEGGEFVSEEKRGISWVPALQGDKPPNSIFISSFIEVAAMTRNQEGKEWGRLLEWEDKDGRAHTYAMPQEMLEGEGVEVRRILADGGVTIGTARRARELFLAFLKLCPTDARALCTGRLGWAEEVFVTPFGAIGATEQRFVFQANGATDHAFKEKGTVQDWRDSVARLAAGNSRLVFAVAAAFAPALLELVGDDGGGFHFQGPSSTGKSTALRAAASVWGGSQYLRLWRATANGLEGIASLHNDGLLVLDELSQCDPFQAGEAAYMLANGQGKQRAGRSGGAKEVARWRLFYLSAGEESLGHVMSRANTTVKAGQEIRMADIAADAGAGLGMFETIHDYDSPSLFAQAIKDATGRFHGTVGQAWLAAVVRERDSLKGTLQGLIAAFVAAAVPPDHSGQAGRVARRFGLVAVAGELASRYGLTGWAEGEATHAAQTCFAAWLEGFGGGATNREDGKILAQVAAFFDAHGASRFQNMTDRDARVLNRAGFYRDGPGDDGVRTYYVLTTVFKSEVCRGYAPDAVAKLLLERGHLQGGSDGRATQKHRLPGMGNSQRVYTFIHLPAMEE